MTGTILRLSLGKLRWTFYFTLGKFSITLSLQVCYAQRYAILNSISHTTGRSTVMHDAADDPWSRASNVNASHKEETLRRLICGRNTGTLWYGGNLSIPASQRLLDCRACMSPSLLLIALQCSTFFVRMCVLAISSKSSTYIVKWYKLRQTYQRKKKL